ncbi:MAG: pilus assembly protein [Planctomycetota bacterium]|nr:pilus assembly protein [Planctomycetota bacterium]
MPLAKRRQQLVEVSKLRKGSHCVEFAIVLPIMLLLFLSGIEFARMNLLRHLAENASYEAARQVIVPGATVEEAEAKANAILSVMGVKGASLTVSPDPVLETTGTVSVKVTFPAKNNLWMVPMFSTNLNFQSETTLLTERATLQQVRAINAITPGSDPPSDPVPPSNPGFPPDPFGL